VDCENSSSSQASPPIPPRSGHARRASGSVAQRDRSRERTASSPCSPSIRGIVPAADGTADAASVIPFRRSLRGCKEMDGGGAREATLGNSPNRAPRKTSTGFGQIWTRRIATASPKSEPRASGRVPHNDQHHVPLRPRWRQAPRQVCHRPRAFQRPEVPKTGLATPPPPWILLFIERVPRGRCSRQRDADPGIWNDGSRAGASALREGELGGERPADPCLGSSVIPQQDASHCVLRNLTALASSPTRPLDGSCAEQFSGRFQRAESRALARAARRSLSSVPFRHTGNACREPRAGARGAPACWRPQRGPMPSRLSRR